MEYIKHEGNKTDLRLTNVEISIIRAALKKVYIYDNEVIYKDIFNSFEAVDFHNEKGNFSPKNIEL